MRGLADEAVGMSSVSGVENDAAAVNGRSRQTMMNHCRRKKAQAGMAVMIVIPGEELLAERTGILERPKAFGEARPVFQSAEVAFRIRVVVGDMGAAVGLGNPQIRH